MKTHKVYEHYYNIIWLKFTQCGLKVSLLFISLSSEKKGCNSSNLTKHYSQLLRKQYECQLEYIPKNSNVQKVTMQERYKTPTSSLMLTTFQTEAATSIIQQFWLVRSEPVSQTTNETISYFGHISALYPGLERKWESECGRIELIPFQHFPFFLCA